MFPVMRHNTNIHDGIADAFARFIYNAAVYVPVKSGLFGR